MKKKQAKLERDGRIGVLISSGYGAGWSTWNTEHAEALLFEPELILALEDDAKNETNAKMEAYMAEHFPDCYIGGMCDLQVHWVPKGCKFQVHEYDGAESLEILTRGSYYIA